MTHPKYRWTKSSRSNATNGGNCVEVASAPGHVALRDSKDPTGPILKVSPDRFAEFVRTVSVGALDG